jgi:hypothetical protein
MKGLHGRGLVARAAQQAALFSRTLVAASTRSRIVMPLLATAILAGTGITDASASTISPAAAAGRAGVGVDSGTWNLYPYQSSNFGLTENGIARRVTISTNPTQWGFVAPSQGGRVRTGYPFTGAGANLDEEFKNDYVMYIMKYRTHDCLGWYENTGLLGVADYGKCGYWPHTNNYLWVQHGGYYINVAASVTDDYPVEMGVQTLTGNSSVVMADQGSPGYFLDWTAIPYTP